MKQAANTHDCHHSNNRLGEEILVCTCRQLNAILWRKRQIVKLTL